MSQTCAYCDQPAEFLCDHPLREQGPDWRLHAESFQTCDKPLCRAHRVYQSSVCWDYTTKGRRRAGHIDSIDLCPDHAPTPTLEIVHAPV